MKAKSLWLEFSMGQQVEFGMMVLIHSNMAHCWMMWGQPPGLAPVKSNEETKKAHNSKYNY